MRSGLVYFFFPIFLSAIAIEIYLTRDRKYIYSFRESFTSLQIFLIHHFINIIQISWTGGILFLTWQYRIFTIPTDAWWYLPLLFIALEFCYYWYHRTAHHVRWLWATHSVHHSATYFNLSAAYRLGWTGWLSGNSLFFLPLSWLGFHPLSISIGLSLDLIYQFWIHTELIPKLGILEWIFNTPSHHRVHHGGNPEYIDRNFGGVLIIFDRLFGTFSQENPQIKIVYGLTHCRQSQNPFAIALCEWVWIFRDIFVAKTWRDRLRVIFGAPV